MIPLGVIGGAHVAPAAAGGPLSGSFLQAVWDASDLTTYTHASQNFGSASADRFIVAVVTGRAGGARTISSVTIGGVTATEAIQHADSGNNVGIYYAAVPSGTSGDVVVVWSAGMVRCGVGLWAVTGGLNTVYDVDYDTASNAGPDYVPDVSLTGVDGGFIVAAVMSSPTPTYSWTNATERYDAAVETGAHSGADATTVGATTITATPTGMQYGAIVGAVFAPAE